MPWGSLIPMLLAAGALGGCGILVDRYDSTSPNFAAEYETEVERASVAAQAAEYCAVFTETAELDRIEVVNGDPYAVFDCL